MYGFCSHDVTLEANLARLVCVIHMVDSAFEKVDVGCYELGIDLHSALLSAWEYWFKVAEYTCYFIFFAFSKKNNVYGWSLKWTCLERS